MGEYFQLFIDSFTGYASYFLHEVISPSWGNYFYWLIAISIIVYALEIRFPWRKDQPTVRKDFWLDLFYVFFNYFLYSLIGFYACSNVLSVAFNDALSRWLGISNLVAIEVQALPVWAHILLLFVVRDFVQWNIHRLLHRVPFLWEMHKVHHSVEQMGFAAHMRYHFGENIVYRTLEYIPLAMLGYGLQDLFLVHMFTLSIGHLNHANIRLPLGPLKYILNSPQMHIWHHAAHIPEGSHGINYGITLSIWDYVFKTAWIPTNGRDIPLGYPGVQDMPNTFWGQVLYPIRFIKNRKNNR